MPSTSLPPARRVLRWSLALLAATAVLAAAPVRAATDAAPAVISYEVRGRDTTLDLEEFAATAAETYADPRGWAEGGGVRFERVAAGGDFALWLAADAQMSSFGGACDTVWSCRSGRNVVINEDRWRGATPAWNEAGAALRDYRHMVVNHETGHWLGLSHQSCATPGAPASVMQQQSMGLQGCEANPWPLAADRQRAVSGGRIKPARPAGGAAVPGKTIVRPAVRPPSVTPAQPDPVPPSVPSRPRTRSGVDCRYWTWMVAARPCV